MRKTNYLALLSAFFITTLITLNAQTFNGYALYNSQNSNTTYLIDKNGNIAHSWSCALAGNYSVHLKENGNLVRGGVYSSNQMNGAAVSGIIQELLVLMLYGNMYTQPQHMFLTMILLFFLMEM
jgi:hypothetical protein